MPKKKGSRSDVRIDGDNRGVIGHVHGDVYFNHGSRLETFGQRVHAARDYLEFLATDCRKLRLRGLDSKADDPALQTKVGLEAVYVGLDTTSRQEADPEASQRKQDRVLRHLEESPPISAFSAVVTHPRLVLLGRPGSGKTTFYNHLAFRFARHWCEPDKGWLEALGHWEESPPEWMPVAVTLRHFVRSLPKARLEEIEAGHKRGVSVPGDVKVLWDFLESQLAHQRLEHCLSAIESATQHGQALWFFDGFDEVPSSALRGYVRSVVECFFNRYKLARVILTCRIVAYQDSRWHLDGVPIFTLARLDDLKQRKFISAWFKAHKEHCGMPQAEAEAKARKLGEALDDPRRRDLKEMAGEPMLLTLMVLLQTSNRELPENRAELYQQAVDLLLKRWDETRSLDGTLLAGLPQALAGVGSDHNELQRVLWHLALHAQKEDFARRSGSTSASKRDTADIPHATLTRSLAWLHPDDSIDWADRELIPLIQERAGLLIEVGHDAEHQPVYAFPHRSFQEYLAGAALIDAPLDKPSRPGQPEAPEPTPFPQRAIELVESSGYWHEVIRWLASRLTHVSNAAHACVSFLKELSPDCPTSVTDWHRVWLAAEALVEMRIEKARKERAGRELLHELPKLLVELVEKEHLPVRPRSQAAIALGCLGDLRPGVGVTTVDNGGIARPLFAWCGPTPKHPDEPFPAGDFKMGGDPQAYGSSKAPFSCSRISQPFFLSKYPVTVAQYRLFVDAKGYERKEFWTAAGWDWLTNQIDTKALREWYREEYRGETFPILGPRNYAPVFQTPNHPRVGVSWFEALAYCRWLNTVIPHEERPALSGKSVIRLPTDAEWERAARHPDGRVFPWGPEESEQELSVRCNWHGAGLQQTSAVGLFPKGQAASGAADLAGNVWEWCQSVWVDLGSAERCVDYNAGRKAAKNLDTDEGFGERVLRGGSWGHGIAGYLRAANRNHNHPGDRNGNCGFRVVCGVESR